MIPFKSYSHFLISLLASSTVSAVTHSEWRNLEELKAQRLEVRRPVISEKLNIRADAWLPSAVSDIRDYFDYHRKVEVFELMDAFNSHLDFKFPPELIRARASLHDIPKTMSLEELKVFGYKGWHSDIAIPFLKVVLKLSEQEVRANFGHGEYLNIDFATRLYFVFGSSRENYKEIFKTQAEQEAVLNELKALPQEINQFEDIIKDIVYSFLGGDQVKKISSREKKKLESILGMKLEVFLSYMDLPGSRQMLNLIENLADWVSRTENALARVEYDKVFERTSTLLKRNRDIMAAKNNNELFIQKKLAEDVGREVLERVGIDFLIDVTEKMETRYASLLVKKQYEKKHRIIKNLVPRRGGAGRPRVDFVREILRVRVGRNGNLCPVVF